MRHSRKFGSVIALLALGVVAGCGGGGKESVKTVGVSGTVYLDKRAVEGVEVHFVSANHSGFAVTAADGTYTLVQGAEPGENKIYFRKTTSGNINLDPETGIEPAMLQAMAEMQAMEGGPRANVGLPKELIPAQFSDPAQSKITLNVPDGGTDAADFHLSSKR